MTNEHSRGTLRPAAGGMITVKIADEIARLKGAAEWRSGNQHATSLVKDAALNVLLMVLKKGAHLHEHRTKGPITVQVVSGSIRFSVGVDQRDFWLVMGGLGPRSRSESLFEALQEGD